MRLTLIVLAAICVGCLARSRKPKTCSNLPTKKVSGMSDSEVDSLIGSVVEAAKPFYLSSDDLQTAKYHDGSKKFFTKFNENAAAFKKDPTYALFRKLEDNYIAKEGKDEHDDGAEKKEIENFLHAVCASPSMVVLQKALEKRGVWKGEFCERVKELWMTYFSRSRGPKDSNGFEHVFISDDRNGKVGGGHYWLTLADKEKAGGFKFQYKIAPGEAIATVRFYMDGAFKSVGSLMIGQPPEVDLAIGTICLLARNGKDCKYHYHGCEAVSKAYQYDEYRGSRCFVSSSFPSIPKDQQGKCANRL